MLKLLVALLAAQATGGPPPSDAQVLRALRPGMPNMPFFHEAHREDVKVVKTRVGADRIALLLPPTSCHAAQVIGGATSSDARPEGVDERRGGPKCDVAPEPSPAAAPTPHSWSVPVHWIPAVTPASARILRVVGSIVPVLRFARVARNGRWH